LNFYFIKMRIKKMKEFWRIFSVIFHPLSVTLYNAILVSFAVNNGFDPFSTTIALFIVIIMPVTTLILLKKFKVISDYDISDKKERKNPLLFFVISGVLSIQFVMIILMLRESLYLILYFLLVIIYLLSFTFARTIKLSAHIAVLVANIIFAAVFFRWELLILFLLVPLMFFSRLKLKRHVLKECFAGLVLGLFSFIPLILLRLVFEK